MEITDFRHSSIRWDTQKERSIGIFDIESVLQIFDIKSQTKETFALSTAVLAGNMYCDQKLAIDPPYLFQIAGGEKDHIIYRTHLHNDHKKDNRYDKPEGSATKRINKNQKIFKSFNLNLKKASATVIDCFDTLHNYCRLGDKLSGMIEFEDTIGSLVKIEFPVKHINLLPEKKRWQLETGPILFPGHIYENNDSTVIGSCLPCFVHANRFESVFITSDFPFNMRYLSEATDRINYHLKCDLRFFTF